MTDAHPPFATTHWSLVAAAGEQPSQEAQVALAELCQAYWYPLYAYVRRRGYGREEAEDLTQQFFGELLERQALQVADPQRGKFRTFLLAALSHFLANQWRSANAQKRGGGQRLLSLDLGQGASRYEAAAADTLTPEKLFERNWATTLLSQALTRLRDEYVAAGKQTLFDRLKGHLAGEPAESYDELAGELRMTAGNLRVFVHRMRQRCRALLRDEIGQTVADPREIDDELKQLFAALSQ